MTTKKIIIGRIGSSYGVKGWSHLISYTDPHSNIFSYTKWQLEIAPDQFAPLNIEAHRPHGSGFVIKVAESHDCDQATLLKGKSIAIERSQLPILKEDEYYWSDLVGLSVTNLAGKSLGTIDHLFATGSNDVIVTNTNLLIPYLNTVVTTVDLEKKIMVVDWEELI